MTGSGISVNNSKLRVVGIILAIASGLLIGSSFVFKKKGLLKSQGVAGEGVAYLKSWLWWTGMIMMILGELCNFAAYAFIEALIVTPLGALSVVICAILSSFFLKETLTFFGWLGCGLCIIGSTVIALNSPSHDTVGQIREFQKLFLAPGFLAWTGVLIAGSLVVLIFVAPKYGDKSMMWYISVCSMIGALSVSCTTGLGSAIVTSVQGDNQFKHWFMYFLLGFVVITLLTEVYYLNKALALFNTAMVTPTYYVIFTTFTLITNFILFKGLDAPIKQILTLVLGFFTICFGIVILQMSKVDPVELGRTVTLDRRSTLLLQAARQNTETVDEKSGAGIEEPGMDALRGSFGTIGSIIRARSARRMSQSSWASGVRPRPAGAGPAFDPGQPWLSPAKSALPLQNVTRHQLYDPPMPGTPSIAAATRGDDGASIRSVPSVNVNKRPTIKFDHNDMVHQYHPPGTATTRMDPYAKHEVRPAHGSPGPTTKEIPRSSGEREAGYPPTGRTEETSLLFSESPHGSPDTAYAPPSIFGRAIDEPKSAPPTVAYQRFKTPARMDSREIFGEGAGPGESENRETLLSFPSVTDSARSFDQESTTSARGRPEKRYPKGPNDREESVGLVNRDDRDRTPTPPSADELDAHGGIRLVTSASRDGLNKF